MPEPSTFTYDLTNTIGVVRLLMNDKYANEPIFFDEEITAFLLLESGDPRRAAAKALETIAADEVLTQKVIKLLGLTTDGSKVAAELRANAGALRAQVAQDGEGLIDIAEWIVDPFSGRQRILNEFDRLG